MVTLWIVWGILTLVVICLAVARRIAARKDDEYVHLSDVEVAAVSQQAALADKLERLDSWGKTLTVIDALFGLVLVVLLFYRTWVQTQALPN